DGDQGSNAGGSSIVLLQNVVGGRAEVDDDLAADMASEGVKCGRIAKVVVHVASDHELQQADSGLGEVSIFLQFADADSAQRAIDLFNGRWFAGRQIVAQLYDPDTYRVLTSADTMVYMP
ncbi:Splicing factor 45, partial [Coemansia erecta]